jgi:hypothetical protein
MYPKYGIIPNVGSVRTAVGQIKTTHVPTDQQ